MLSRDDIRRALLALAGELKELSARCEIVVVGGAAVVLLYGAREATKDVDVVILSRIDPTLVRRAVQRVAGALGLPDDWLNDAAKGYVGRPSMDLRDLVRALLSFDALAARQWVADSLREGIVWASIPAPIDLDPVASGWRPASQSSWRREPGKLRRPGQVQLRRFPRRCAW